eukprot:5996147-Amphidinium_carterae.3
MSNAHVRLAYSMSCLHESAAVPAAHSSKMPDASGSSKDHFDVWACLSWTDPYHGLAGQQRRSF